MGNRFTNSGLPKTFEEFDRLDIAAKAELMTDFPAYYNSLFYDKFGWNPSAKLNTFAELMTCREDFIAQFKEKQPEEYSRLYTAEFGHTPKY